MKVIQDIDFGNTTIIASNGKLKTVSPANNPLHGVTNEYFLIRSNYIGLETMVIPYITFVL